MTKQINLFFLTAIIFFSTTIHAKEDKSKNCPLLNQINYAESRLFAYNSENKSFSSGYPCSFCDDITNMKPLSFLPELTKYNAVDKILSCVYKVKVYYQSGGTKTELKILRNRGDY